MYNKFFYDKYDIFKKKLRKGEGGIEYLYIYSKKSMQIHNKKIPTSECSSGISNTVFHIYLCSKNKVHKYIK